MDMKLTKYYSIIRHATLLHLSGDAVRPSVSLSGCCFSLH